MTGKVSDSANVGISSLKKNKLLLIPVYLVVFSAFFDTHAQMPILAPYARSLGADPFFLGLVIGAYSFFNIIGNYSSGIIIDRKNWKLPLFIGLAAVSLVLLLYTLAESSVDLVLIRSGHGLMGGILIPAALACLTISYDSDPDQGQRLAFFGAVIGLAAVTGPIFAGVIAINFGYALVYYSLAGLMAVAAIISLFSLRGIDNCNKPNNPNNISMRKILRMPLQKGALFFAFGTMGSTGTLAAFLPIRSAMLDFNHAQTGMLFTTFALTAIMVQISWPRKLKQLFKTDQSGCTTGLLLLCLALVLSTSVSSRACLFASLALFGIGFGLSFQGMLGLIISGSQPQWQGRAIGLFFAFYSLGVAVIPPLGGLIWQHIPLLFPFYTAAGTALVSMVIGHKACTYTGEAN